MTLAKMILIYLIALPVVCLCFVSLVEWYSQHKYGKLDE